MESRRRDIDLTPGNDCGLVASVESWDVVKALPCADASSAEDERVAKMLTISHQTDPQGPVWGWLIGPFVDAWLKVHPSDLNTARQFLEGFRAELGTCCIGTISEVFDAEAPFTPRGCVAQAWSVAEVLRVHERLRRI